MLAARGSTQFFLRIYELALQASFRADFTMEQLTKELGLVIDKLWPSYERAAIDAGLPKQSLGTELVLGERMVATAYAKNDSATPAVVQQLAKRYAERWCAARLYPDLLLRQAVARLTDSTPIQPSPPLPRLPPTREQQQQARRLAEAGAKEVERIKAALEPRKPPTETKPRPRDARKEWMRAGLQLGRR